MFSQSFQYRCMMFEATLDTSKELVLFVSLDVKFLNTFQEIILNKAF